RILDPRGPHVKNARILRDVANGLTRLDGVAGYDDLHVGEGAHDGDIFDHLVRAAIGTDRDAAVSRNELHRHLSVADGLTNLLPATSGDENGEGADEHDFSGQGETGSGANHVLLRNAHVDE